MIDRICELIVSSLLYTADIQVNGSREWDIRVNDPRFYRDVLTRGSLGLGESYMQGWWNCAQIDAMICRLLKTGLDDRLWFSPATIGRWVRDRFQNPATLKRARLIAEAHYDLGNDLFEIMLGPTMAYTCGYWPKGVEGLNAAQIAKYDLVCRKLGLGRGQSVLDIGCGFGGFAKHAAENYGVSVTGITVSREQAEWAQAHLRGLPVEFLVADYREFRDWDKRRFNHVVSLGMFEHVEPKNYSGFFKMVRACLEPGGYFLLHTIGKPRGDEGSDPWIRKYIFPLGMIPVRREIVRRSQKHFRGILDWHALDGQSYDHTLSCWYHNFASHWGELDAKYGSRFRRMWEYYLLGCAGAFRAGRLDVWQIVFAQEAYRYDPVR